MYQRYIGYVESSLFVLLLASLGQNEHPKNLSVSMAFNHVGTYLQQKSGRPGELYIAKAAENCGFLLVVPIISRTPTMLISPPYVNSETTFRHKKRASDSYK